MLGRVDTVVVSESLGLRKPHPLMVRDARSASLDVAAATRRCMVGDTFAEDVEAAHAAGVDAAWIDRAARRRTARRACRRASCCAVASRAGAALA